jgi:hypothetical protein
LAEKIKSGQRFGVCVHFRSVGFGVFGWLVMLASMQYDFALRSNAYEQSLSIAEAGINYYRWHLAHSPQDYTDGTGGSGTLCA